MCAPEAVPSVIFGSNENSEIPILAALLCLLALVVNRVMIANRCVCDLLGLTLSTSVQCASSGMIE